MPKPYCEARHLIVDIETLGTEIPAPILSIGAVLLDLTPSAENPVETRQWVVSPAECIGQPQLSNVLWWFKQSKEARDAVFEAQCTPNALASFAKYAAQAQPDYFWGKSHDFDFGHLAAQLQAKGLRIPWNFWQLRDIRTIEGLGLDRPCPKLNIIEALLLDISRSGKKHMALTDAGAEALMLFRTLVQLRERSAARHNPEAT